MRNSQPVGRGRAILGNGEIKGPPMNAEAAPPRRKPYSVGKRLMT